MSSSEDSLDLYSPLYRENPDLFFGHNWFGEGSLDSTELVSYDLDSEQVLGKWGPFEMTDGTKMISVLRYDISSSGTKHYGTGFGTGGTRFFIYDLENAECLHSSVFPWPNGDVALSPDGEEAYVTDAGDRSFTGRLGKLAIYNSNTGALLKEITDLGLDSMSAPMPKSFFFPRDICFHPDSNKVYVTAGSIGNVLGPILVIDTDKREIVNWLLPDFAHSPVFLAIGPKMTGGIP